MTFTALSVVILTLSVGVFFRYIRKGRKKGVARSLAGLANVLFSAFVGVLVSVGVSKIIVYLIIELISGLDFYVELISVFAGLGEIILILLGMLVSLIIFLPVFGILRLIVAIVAGMFFKRAEKNRKRKPSDYLSEDEEFYVKHSALFGGIIGAVSAFLVIIVVFSPLVGIIKKASKIIDIYSDFTGEDSISEIEPIKLVDDFSNDFVVTAIDACGGRLFFDMTARTEYHGQSAYLNKEIDVISNIDYEQLLGMLEKFSSPTDETIDELLAMLDELDNSVIIKSVVVANVCEASKSWLNGDAYMGIERPSFSDNATVDEFLNEVLYVCSTTTFESFNQDIETLLCVSRIFRDKMNVFNTGDYTLIITELVEDDTANKLRAELDKNDHMRPIMYAVDDLIMSIVVEELYDSHKFSEISRNALYTNFAEILTETLGLDYSVREESVASNVESYLTDYGLFLPEGLNETISEMLIQNVGSDTGEITIDDVQSFFEQYLGAAGN